MTVRELGGRARVCVYIHARGRGTRGSQDRAVATAVVVEALGEGGKEDSARDIRTDLGQQPGNPLSAVYQLVYPSLSLMLASVSFSSSCQTLLIFPFRKCTPVRPSGPPTALLSALVASINRTIFSCSYPETYSSAVYPRLSPMLTSAAPSQMRGAVRCIPL
jgi:hypothetical protein